MEATTSFEAENKLISLDNKNCSTLREKKQVACTALVSCLKYNGINLPATIDLEISWILDSKKPKTPRMFFISDEGKNIKNSTIRLYRGKSECRTDAVYIADGIRDKLTSLEVEMKYNIRQTSTSYTTSTVSRRKRANLDPVIDENRGTVQRDSINIAKNCGKDNICIPDLRLDAKTNENYLLGANESLIVDVLITNHGEDAFESNFFMNIPKGLNYKSTRKIGDSRETSYTCTAPSVHTNNTLKCDLGNPLPAGKSVNFKVIMEPTKRGGKKSIEPFYEFYMEANSTNEEADGGRFDNILKKSVAIFVESDISISGGSNPAEIHYNASLFKSYLNSSTLEGEIGPQVVHIYDIRNNGTTTIEEVVVFIQWPARTLEGDDLMYLLNQPETLGPVQCDLSPFVNHASLKLDSVLRKKSYLDKNRILFDDPKRDNIPDGPTFDEESHEVTGTHSAQRWDSQGGRQTSSGRQTSGGRQTHDNRQTSGGQHHVSGGSSGSSGSGVSSSHSEDRFITSGGEEKFRGTQHGFKWDESQGRVGSESSSNVRESGGRTSASGGSSGGRSSGSSGSSGTYRHESGSGQTSSGSQYGGLGRTQSNYDYGRTTDGTSGGTRVSSGTGGGSNVNEYEYHEKWNSSSVNGGPTVTHVEKTWVRDENGRTIVETSTDRVVSGGAAGTVGWNSHSSSGSRQHEESSQSNAEYERQQREHYENQRRYQEAERAQQIEDRRIRQEQQRRTEEKRLRLEEERRHDEEERRRAQYEETHRTQSGGSGYQSSYNRQSENRASGGSNSGFSSDSSSNFNSGSSSNVHSGSSTNVNSGSTTNFNSGSSSGGR